MKEVDMKMIDPVGAIERGWFGEFELTSIKHGSHSTSQSSVGTLIKPSLTTIQVLTTLYIFLKKEKVALKIGGFKFHLPCMLPIDTPKMIRNRSSVLSTSWQLLRFHFESFEKKRN